jgi:excisionase family DNA binding protein
MELWTEEQFAQHAKISRSTIQKMRVRGNSCPYLKVGRLVRYNPEDVQAWLASRVTTSTSQKAA